METSIPFSQDRKRSIQRHGASTFQDDDLMAEAVWRGSGSSMSVFLPNVEQEAGYIKGSIKHAPIPAVQAVVAGPRPSSCFAHGRNKWKLSRPDS